MGRPAGRARARRGRQDGRAEQLRRGVRPDRALDGRDRERVGDRRRQRRRAGDRPRARQAAPAAVLRGARSRSSTTSRGPTSRRRSTTSSRRAREHVDVRYRYASPRAPRTKVPSTHARADVHGAHAGVPAGRRLRRPARRTRRTSRSSTTARRAGRTCPARASSARRSSASGFLGAFSPGFTMPACGTRDRLHAQIVIGGPGLDGDRGGGGARARRGAARRSPARSTRGGVAARGRPRARASTRRPARTTRARRPTRAARSRCTCRPAPSVHLDACRARRADRVGARRDRRRARRDRRCRRSGTIRGRPRPRAACRCRRGCRCVPASGRRCRRVPAKLRRAADRRAAGCTSRSRRRRRHAAGAARDAGR